MLVRTAALLLLFLSLWSLRSLGGSSGVSLEVNAILIDLLYAILSPAYRKGGIYQVGVLSLVTLSFLVWAIFTLSPVLNLSDTKSLFLRSHRGGPRAAAEVGVSLSKPFLVPCQTTHTRLFPNKHKFSYSYLHLAIPVGWTGSIGSFLSVDSGSDDFTIKGPCLQSKTLFNVKPADYLERGSTHLNLSDKLRAYLHSQGDDLDTYTSAWLFTAPRFLGYAFNPVSFWYLYRGSYLGAMILEVNNTFDEKRLYLMRNDLTIEDSGGNGFNKKWSKDFHVSPFNSRKGSYSLMAKDPMVSGAPIISNTITLRSSKGHPKLVARITSNGAAIDPADMTVASKARFIVAWWWVGLATYPRIVKEATVLFFRRNLHIWFRPEVLRTSIGRRETPRERILETCFRLWLESLIKDSSSQTTLKYVAAGSHCAPVETFAPRKQETEASGRMLEISLQVLSPVFYSLFATTANPAEFITICTTQPLRTQTFHASDPAAIGALIRESALRRPTSRPALFWWLLQVLRKSNCTHPLDDWVRTKAAPELATAYRRVIGTLLVSQWAAFGIPELLDLLLVLIRLIMCYSSTRIFIDGLCDWQNSKDWNISWAIANLHLWLIIDEWIAVSRGSLITRF